LAEELPQLGLLIHSSQAEALHMAQQTRPGMTHQQLDRQKTGAITTKPKNAMLDPIGAMKARNITHHSVDPMTNIQGCLIGEKSWQQQWLSTKLLSRSRIQLMQTSMIY